MVPGRLVIVQPGPAIDVLARDGDRVALERSELEIREIVVPPYAGNFSAWGLLGADLVQSAARTRIMPLDDASLAEVDVELERLFAGLATSAAALEGGAEESAVDLRYVGQEHFLTVALPGGARAGLDAAALRERFTADYRRAFGLTMDGAIEIVAVRATVRRSLPRRPFADQPARRGGAPEAHAAVEAWSFTTGARARFPIYDREALCAEDVVAGPAIIVEATATTYVDAEFTARVAPSGALFIDDARGA